ncbi:MAG: P-II family nitrogen regulator [Tissierellia bacterium]|jgi:nitrogen regulatory protein PII|nr:P-II family nitrogen regulator [Bacillota bacterium]NLK59126.1 P-II family nitrogen regulator [Tissierellia bacterium]
MLTNSDSTMLLAVLQHGLATPFCRSAEKIRNTGHTIFLGHGTARNRVLQWLGIDEVKKEIAMLIVPKEDEDAFFRMAIDEYKLQEKNTGILIAIDIMRSFGMAGSGLNASEIDKEAEVTYKAIFTIVDKDKADDVMDAAERAGARGGTLIHARGAGIHEKKMLFNIQVEPEKEILMVIAPTEDAKHIAKTIAEDMKIEEPGNGMMFILNVDNAVGMVKEPVI